MRLAQFQDIDTEGRRLLRVNGAVLLVTDSITVGIVDVAQRFVNGIYQHTSLSHTVGQGISLLLEMDGYISIKDTAFYRIIPQPGVFQSFRVVSLGIVSLVYSNSSLVQNVGYTIPANSVDYYLHNINLMQNGLFVQYTTLRSPSQTSLMTTSGKSLNTLATERGAATLLLFPIGTPCTPAEFRAALPTFTFVS